MIRIIDTSARISELFESGKFNIEKWESYINSVYPNCSDMFLDEVREYTKSGEYTFEKDFLPIIEAVYQNERLQVLCDSFRCVTNGLHQRIAECFGKELDIDIVLYLGLCNGAGWVTCVDGRDVILLGIEKIIELGWHTVDAMRGLVYHELGHVYHIQYGVFEQEASSSREEFIYQLFTEGVAMYFEQTVVGDDEYYHQDKDGWKAWCDEHFADIVRDFDTDLPTMNRFDQRYFGDWADYCGKGDVGYYLGARFVRFLLKKHSFDALIELDIAEVCNGYDAFVRDVNKGND